MATRRSGVVVAALAAGIVSAGLAAPAALAQRRPQGPPLPAQKAALIDVTGYWTTVISADWRWRMMTPPIGDFSSVPLNPAGIQLTMAWNPQRDIADGAQCRAYGAAGVMRLPTRLHVHWADDETLEIDTDAGQQQRMLHFKGQWNGGAPTPQGWSSASWYKQLQAAGFGPPYGGPQPGKGGTLKVVTTHMTAGYLRRNGVPYSENAVYTEYFDRLEDDGTTWLIDTSVVNDPTYLRDVFITTETFKQESDGSKWDPQPCKVVPPTSSALPPNAFGGGGARRSGGGAAGRGGGGGAGR